MLEALFDSSPFHVLRCDIKSFFENVDANTILSEILDSTKTHTHIKTVLRELESSGLLGGTLSGVPHGLGLSSTFAESSYSLRAPYRVLPEVSKDEMKKLGKVKKLDLAHVAPEDGRLEINFAPSFFSVRKHNLLDKFYSSNELLRLESKFLLLRKIDVTKCFFNIYTHSLTWAVKDKAYSKAQANKYTFEGRFDTLMQRSNYNETNGIVVGPEISRVFAEVIFQKIDRNIIGRMDSNLREGRDYTFRRYVDDFFLFARNEAVLDELTQAVETCLEEYKLFPNEGKRQNLKRPFVTNITQAKQGIGNIANKLGLVEIQDSHLV